MVAEPTSRLFTVAEYYEMGRAGILTADDRVELIEGTIVRMPPIGSPHASSVLRLSTLFNTAARNEALVSVQNPLRLGDRSEPVPDLMVLRPRADFYANGHPAAGDTLLVVEVSDTTLSHDTNVKVPLYARSLVGEVWIVDLTKEAVHTYRQPVDGAYTMVSTHTGTDVVACQALSRITLRVAEIFGRPIPA